MIGYWTKLPEVSVQCPMPNAQRDGAAVAAQLAATGSLKVITVRCNEGNKEVAEGYSSEGRFF